ncbi:hypothetical protein XENTR_v10008011 [Xenopus tropicalis]|nr:hypothetical protein XENTR_v10008011 [Xenopus tropicalis]
MALHHKICDTGLLSPSSTCSLIHFPPILLHLPTGSLSIYTSTHTPAHPPLYISPISPPPATLHKLQNHINLYTSICASTLPLLHKCPLTLFYTSTPPTSSHCPPFYTQNIQSNDPGCKTDCRF